MNNFVILFSLPEGGGKIRLAVCWILRKKNSEEILKGAHANLCKLQQGVGIIQSLPQYYLFPAHLPRIIQVCKRCFCLFAFACMRNIWCTRREPCSRIPSRTCQKLSIFPHIVSVLNSVFFGVSFFQMPHLFILSFSSPPLPPSSCWSYVRNVSSRVKSWFPSGMTVLISQP